MISELSRHGKKLVNIVDPHLSTRQEYLINQKFKQKGIKLFRIPRKNSRWN